MKKVLTLAALLLTAPVQAQDLYEVIIPRDVEGSVRYFSDGRLKSITMSYEHQDMERTQMEQITQHQGRFTEPYRVKLIKGETTRWIPLEYPKEFTLSSPRVQEETSTNPIPDQPTAGPFQPYLHLMRPKRRHVYIPPQEEDSLEPVISDLPEIRSLVPELDNEIRRIRMLRRSFERQQAYNHGKTLQGALEHTR